MAVGFGVDVRPLQPATLVLSGEFDQAGVGKLESTFRWVGARHGRSNVIIDVSALDFCDSAAWGAIERCCTQVRRCAVRHRACAALLPDSARAPAAAGLDELRGLDRTSARHLLSEDARAA